MTVRDRQGLVLTGTSEAAGGFYRDAVKSYHCYAGEPFPLLRAAIADSPGFVMAHVLVAYMTLVGSDPRVRRLGLAAVAATEDVKATTRETGHVAAVNAIKAGELQQAARILEDVSIAEPRDVLALQAGQQMDFLTGDARMLRDRISRALPAWSDGGPSRHSGPARLRP